MEQFKYDLSPCPFASFAAWHDVASQKEDNHDAFSLATCGKEGRPSCRYLLLKGHGEEGFKFYTNKLSLKGRQISENPFGEMAFYWRQLGRQVRVSGSLEPLDREETARLYTQRALESRLATHISRQGEKLESREQLLESYQKAKDSLREEDLTLPDHWEGYRLMADCFVFFVYGDHRLNERFCYQKREGTWETTLLYP